jgi:hypothetical protein
MLFVLLDEKTKKPPLEINYSLGGLLKALFKQPPFIKILHLDIAVRFMTNIYKNR